VQGTSSVCDGITSFVLLLSHPTTKILSFPNVSFINSVTRIPSLVLPVSRPIILKFPRFLNYFLYQFYSNKEIQFVPLKKEEQTEYTKTQRAEEVV
jgi:hypothetical protein